MRDKAERLLIVSIGLLIVSMLVLVLTGCSTTKQPTPLVVQTTPIQNISIPTVNPPPRSNPPSFEFQKPGDPTSIVALNSENYQKLRELLLYGSKREIDWYNRLFQANGRIKLLQE